MLDKNALFITILEILEINESCSLNDKFNLFQYDSFTKLNLILALETFADNQNLSIDELVICDTYQDLINLAEEMYSESHK